MSIYIGLRKISKRMGFRSPQTVLSLSQRYADQDLNFPLVIRSLPNGRFIYITDDLLIKDYLKAHRRKQPEQLKRVSRHRPKITRRMCERCGEVILGHRGYAALQKILSKD